MKHILLTPAEREALTRLGQTLKLGRLRRNLSQQDMAERMGVSRSTIIALENGTPGIAIGTLLKALDIFGYPERLGSLLADDPIGDELDLATGRQRVRHRHDMADF